MAVSTTSAASSTCSSASSLSIPDVKLFLSPTVENRSVRLSRRSFGVNSFSRRSIQLSYRCIRLQNRARAVKGETTVIEERESQLLRELNGNGAASSNGSKYGVNGSSSNGRLGVVGSEMDGGNNGSLTKYVNGNGSASADEKAAEAAEDGRKKRIEEVGKEDAWFKGASNGKVEVSVVPGGRWNRFKTYSTIRRTLEIWGNVFAFIFKVWLNNQKFSYRGGMTEEKKIVRRKALAKWLKESILRLGPTFIKIGQQFSTRVDILAQEYVDQLSELQDQVPPFPSETALSIVEEELGAPVEDIFDRFDYEPIAAASLGQVHRARLKGQEVVLKVQRPGLKDLFDIDLKNLRVIAEYLQKVDPKSDGAKRDWVAIYDECANVLYQEIDYTKEAANAEQFANNFKDMAYVKVPNIVWEYTTPQVLTMEYVPGIKINKVKALDQLGLDRKRLGRYAVESYLEQILSHGFFHADPHPGNIAVDDVNGGRLIFYDFGMMGSISPNIREGLLEVFYGVYEKDSDKVLQAMVQMGVLVPTGDMTAVRRTAQFFLNSFEERLAAQRREREIANAELGFKKPLSKEEKLEKKKQRLAAIGEDLLSIAGDQPFRFPATFTFVVRAFSVLDGIGKGLDPRFDITEIAKPYALELLKFREAGVEVVVKDLRNRWDRQSRAFFNLFRQADRVEKLAETIQRLEQGDLKLRVRTLEAERAFQRVAAVQTTVGSDAILMDHSFD
ncbi:Protein ACTIVITY OF BC1 COMPLEX KINASE 8, chloroplastic [Linum grandiflorum]